MIKRNEFKQIPVKKAGAAILAAMLMLSAGCSSKTDETKGNKDRDETESQTETTTEAKAPDIIFEGQVVGVEKGYAPDAGTVLNLEQWTAAQTYIGENYLGYDVNYNADCGIIFEMNGITYTAVACATIYGDSAEGNGDKVRIDVCVLPQDAAESIVNIKDISEYELGFTANDAADPSVTYEYRTQGSLLIKTDLTPDA